MSQPAPHLTKDEVAYVLRLVQEANAIVVGGQSMAIWARHYADYNPEIPKTYTMSSEDIDFYGNRKVAEAFAQKLGNAKLYVPDFDDHTPNSAQVAGMVGSREIRVDFMYSILGVPSRSIENNFITLTGERTDNQEPIDILVLHPLDCLRSRLSNINDLKRRDQHSVSTARAAILVVDAFINDLLVLGETQLAQTAIQDLRYITLTKCFGTVAHLEFGLDPRWIFQKYLDDERLDARWRAYQLTASLMRLNEKAAFIAAQQEAKNPKQS